MFTKFASKFHTLFSSSALSLIRRTASAHAEFSGCSSTTNAHSETGQMAVCCQNLTLGARSSHSARYMLVGAQFEKFGLFLNTPLIMIQYSLLHVPAVDHHLQAVITVITIWYQKCDTHIVQYNVTVMLWCTVHAHVVAVQYCRTVCVSAHCRKSHTVSQCLSTAVLQWWQLQLLDKLLLLLTGLPTSVDISQSLIYFVV